MSIEYPLNINGNELVKTWSLLKKIYANLR